MKKYVCAAIIIALVLFAFSGCVTMTEDSYEVNLTTNDLLKTAPLVFLGRVKAEGQGRYRNAEKVHYYADGHAMFNYWITPYTVEVLEVYKGDLAENITELTVGTYNHHSPEEKQDDEAFYLKASDTAIFCVRYEAVDDCYKPLYNHKGVFFPDKTLKTYTAEGNAIDITDIDNVLKKAEVSGTDHIALAGQKMDIKAEHKKQTVK